MQNQRLSKILNLIFSSKGFELPHVLGLNPLLFVKSTAVQLTCATVLKVGLKTSENPGPTSDASRQIDLRSCSGAEPPQPYCRHILTIVSLTLVLFSSNFT
jgi:hypothetical protein